MHVKSNIMCSGACMIISWALFTRLRYYLDDGNSCSHSAYYAEVLFEQVSNGGLTGLHV